MTATIHGWTIALDDHPPVPATLTVEPAPVEYVRSYSAILPDPNWLFEDSHGHLHVWTETGRDRRGLPSLVQSEEHRECNGLCGGVCQGEGYYVPVWHCVDCGDPVEPGVIPDREARDEGIPIVVGPSKVSATAWQWPFGSGEADQFAERRALLRHPETGQEFTTRAWPVNWDISDSEVSVEIRLATPRDWPGTENGDTDGLR